MTSPSGSSSSSALRPSAAAVPPQAAAPAGARHLGDTGAAAASAVPEALAALVGRHSLGIKHLGEPGPDDAALAWMAEAALHAPDHAELVPFRFKAVRGAAREKLAELFCRAALESGKDAASVEVERERALRAPVTVALVARIDLGHPLVPAHEQWVAVGGALANFLHAAHALGYAGKMLSGAKVRQPAIAQAFCEPGETLVGWVALGTAQRAPASRRPKAAPGDVLQDWGA